MDPLDVNRSAPLVAEDLMLLLTDDVSGRTAAGQWSRPLFGGALLVELALQGSAVVDPSSGKGLFASTKILATTPAVGGAADPLLARAWSTVAERPRTAQDLVQRLGRGTREAVAARLAARGILERKEGRVLGLFPTVTWPARDVAHERAVRDRIHGCLVLGVSADPRTAALIGLLNAVDQVHRVLQTGLPPREAKRRATAISQGDWASDAVKQAVAAATTAAMTATTAAVVAST